MLSTGFKFRFDPEFQRLDQIEIYVDREKLSLNKGEDNIPPDMLLGQEDGFS